MARKSRPTFKKRQKEIARQTKARDKMTRRLTKSEEEPEEPRLGLEDEDPDIAGVRPGPQPLPDEWNYVSNTAPAASKPKPEPSAEPRATEGRRGIVVRSSLSRQPGIRPSAPPRTGRDLPDPA